MIAGPDFLSRPAIHRSGSAEWTPVINLDDLLSAAILPAASIPTHLSASTVTGDQKCGAGGTVSACTAANQPPYPPAPAVVEEETGEVVATPEQQ